MDFEWDEGKNQSNQRKHGVSFDEALTVFDDPLAATNRDFDHAQEEERFLTFGYSLRRRLLAVSHTDRERRIRLISARLATKAERKSYEQA